MTPKVPSLADVLAAWTKAGRTTPQWMEPSLARPWFQGAVEEHLRQQAERAKNPRLYAKLYKRSTAAELRAFKIVRAWLEFSP